MSPTKEQLANIYIVNDCQVKRDTYIDTLDGDIVAYHGLPSESMATRKKPVLSDLIDLENSKVYTTDPEVVRMYGELCGLGVSSFIHSDDIGVWWHKEAGQIGSFLENSAVDCNELFHEITEAQVRALYREKFGDSDKETDVNKLKVDPSAYEEGMRNAMNKIAKSCGKTFGVDIGYEQLPELVESLVSKPAPKPRIRTEYVKVEMDTNDIAKAMIDGEVFYNKSGTAKFYWDGEKFTNDDDGHCYVIGDYYRKQEVEVDWRDELCEYSNQHGVSDGEIDGLNWRIGDAYFTDEGMVEACRVVLRAKGEID